MVADREPNGIEAVAGAIERRPRRSSAVACDVTDESQLQALVDATEDRFGPIDLFCSNAGVDRRSAAPTPPTRTGSCSLDVNVMAHVYAARILVPRMIERGGGYLLQTASAAGLLTQIGSAPYSVTKHAALALAEWLAITYGDQGIKVSVLAPQAVRTAMTAGVVDGGVAGVDGMLEPDAVADAVVARARRGVVPDPAAPAGARVLPAQGVRLRTLAPRACAACKRSSAAPASFVAG